MNSQAEQILDEISEAGLGYTPRSQSYLRQLVIAKLVLFTVLGPLAAALIYELCWAIKGELLGLPTPLLEHVPVLFHAAFYFMCYVLCLFVVATISALFPIFSFITDCGFLLLHLVLGLLVDVLWFVPRVLIGANVDFFLFLDSPNDSIKDDQGRPQPGPPVLFSRTVNLLLTCIVAAGTCGTIYAGLPKYRELVRKGDVKVAEEEYRQEGVAIEAPLIQQAIDDALNAVTVEEAKSAILGAKTAVSMSTSYQNERLQRSAFDKLQLAYDNLPSDSEARTMQVRDWKPKMEDILRQVLIPR